MGKIMKYVEDYSQYPLPRIPVISNFLFGFFRFSQSLQRFFRLFSILYLKRFHFTHLNVERIQLKNLIEYLSFLISTQQLVGQAKT